MSTPPRSGVRERLLPRWWVWLLVGSFAAMLGVAYGAALGATAGWVIGLPAGGIAAWLLWITSPVVSVDGDGVHAAGALLPPRAIGAVEARSREDLAAARGPGADVRMFTVLRPWSASGGVAIEVVDSEDPHPGWLVSSRHPQRLVDAIRDIVPDRADGPAVTIRDEEREDA